MKMKWRASRVFTFPNCNKVYHLRRLHFATLLRNVQPAQARISAGGGHNGSSSQGNFLLVPGATIATIVMLGALHARRLYDDKMVEEAREKGVELEFHPDTKARFLRLLPLRTISRCWGSLTGMELPILLRPYVYKAWARAFHSRLEEAQLPLEEYASLKEFFVRMLKEGSRPINSDPYCLVSPVDGTVLRFGELRGSGAMIEQVKGFSYSASSLIGANLHLPMLAAEDIDQETAEEDRIEKVEKPKSWWRVSLASPKVRNTASSLPMKGLFYCVLYLSPGDYHRIHSPVDWNVLVRRHFTGHLFPVNERAARTIRNLYVENERVVLEGQWREGYMAMAAVGATNIGSIEGFSIRELSAGMLWNAAIVRGGYSTRKDTEICTCGKEIINWESQISSFLLNQNCGQIILTRSCYTQSPQKNWCMNLKAWEFPLRREMSLLLSTWDQLWC